ncbi:sulfur carrier protein ThiS [Staphylococcus canis]|uniref:Sulfur carrier protein ThiS n=1 Tax=Staphylococcus canis TaxID=2724942 RepID=A0ABS0T5F3_9STAP|nr:sulfur carrier protein ThiS [Staphylococcus canis]MBI5973989.1 sulfur carrier protein ThiS [Staphylococcus canis]
MEVIVNGETQEFKEGITIQHVLDHFEIESKRMAVERNAEVVKRSEWSTTEVRPNDRLELLEFVGGG